MSSCTIIISHFESLPFLKACVSQIRNYRNDKVRQKIIICDQSSGDTFNKILELYNAPDITCVHTKSLYSGYGIDYLLHNDLIDTEYICQVHVDIVPMNNNWLLLPITLIEENNFSFVGQLQFINLSENLASIYPPEPFFAMAQCFNVAKTETYQDLSLNAGFTRFHNRPQSGLEFDYDDWNEWAAADYINRGSDDDVVAFHWQDKYKSEDKLGLAITGFISAAYGRIIEDIVFHFGSCRESIGTGNAMGDEYKMFTEKINENYSDELIEQMVELAKQNKPPHMEILSRNVWNGTLKKTFPSTPELDKIIDELKNS